MINFIYDEENKALTLRLELEKSAGAVKCTDSKIHREVLIMSVMREVYDQLQDEMVSMYGNKCENLIKVCHIDGEPR